MKLKPASGLRLLFVIASLASLAASVPTCADTVPTHLQVDEFGVLLGDTPPPAPAGFASQDEYEKAALAGKLGVFCLGAPVPLPEGVIETTDIHYGKAGEKDLALDVYRPAHMDKSAPAILLFHEGGYRLIGARQFYKYYGVRYAKRGYVVACVWYRFASKHPFPAPLQDAKCAVRWMRANAATYNVNPDKIAAMGIGAGGYLALMLGYTPNIPELEGEGGCAGVSSQIQAVVDLYGPCDASDPKIRQSQALELILGTDYPKDAKFSAFASPICHITADAPPTLILHGTIDATVPIAQSDQLAAKLEEMGVPCQFEKFEGWPHDMDTAVDINKRCQWFINKWLEKYLR